MLRSPQIAKSKGVVMPILSLRQCSFVLVLLSCSLAVQADDLHFKKTISVGGTTVSSSEVWVKGARERSVTNSPTGTTVVLRQCDLKRSVTLNEKTQAYIASSDIQDEEAMKAAAL